MRNPTRATRPVRVAALAVIALVSATVVPAAVDVLPAQAIGADPPIQLHKGSGLVVGADDIPVPGIVDAVFAADGITLLTLARRGDTAELAARVLPALAPPSAPLAELSGTPVALGVAPNQLDAVVAVANPDALVFIDIMTGGVRERVALDAEPSTFQLTRDGARAYVLSATERVVTVVDLADGTVLNRIDAGENPVDLALDAQQTVLWVSDDASTPVVHRWALPSLVHTTIPMWGAAAAGDLATVPVHGILLALDPVRGEVHVTGTISTFFPFTFTGLAAGQPASRLVVGDDQTSVDVVGESAWARHDVRGDTFPVVASGAVAPGTTDLVVPPSAPPGLVGHGIATSYDPVANTYTLSTAPGQPEPSGYLWQFPGEAPITTSEPRITRGFATSGDVPVTVTALRPPVVGSPQYTGRSFLSVPGDGASASGYLRIAPIRAFETREYVASERVEYWQLPDDTYTVTITARGARGGDGEDAFGYNPDHDKSLGGPGSPGGTALSVTISFDVGGPHFVQPGDTLGIVSDGSGGNLLGGVGGDGDGNAGDGGTGGNGSGVFVATDDSTQPWIVIAPGGGGGGGGVGFIGVTSRETNGGSAALDPADTAGRSAQQTGSGDAGIAPGLCAPVGVEHDGGPRSADPAQNGGRGADGTDAASGGGAGGGGAGCFGGSGGTNAWYQAGPGGGGGVAYSRYRILSSSASTAPAHVTVSIDRLVGTRPGAQFTSATTARAVVGRLGCVELHLEGGRIGPVVASGVGWLKLLQQDEHHYSACGTPGPGDAGIATLHATALDWGVSTDVSIRVVAPVITAPDAEVRAGSAVRLPVVLTDFSEPTTTVSGLPPGLSYLRASLDGTRGEIRGTVPAGHDGVWPVRITVADGAATVTRDVALTVVSEVNTDGGDPDGPGPGDGGVTIPEGGGGGVVDPVDSQDGPPAVIDAPSDGAGAGTEDDADVGDGAGAGAGTGAPADAEADRAPTVDGGTAADHDRSRAAAAPLSWWGWLAIVLVALLVGALVALRRRHAAR